MEYKTEEKLDAAVMEFEHAIGCTTTKNCSLFHHPNKNGYVHVTGGSIVICDFDDPHKQEFFRHPSFFSNPEERSMGNGATERQITSIALSKNGKFLAAGYGGNIPNVYLWNFETKELIWNFEEHDEPVVSIDFSHDERLLITNGYDKKLVIWDVKTGCIVSQVDLPKLIGDVHHVRWGGFAKNVKRRDTTWYQFATCGERLCTWVLNPYSGEVSYEVAKTHRNIRKFNCIEFVHTPDSCGRQNHMDEWIIGGTTSGDFVAYSVTPGSPESPTPKAAFVTSVRSCKGGILTMLRDPSDENTIVVGGGDGTVTIFCYRADEGTWIDSEGFRVWSPVYSLSFSNDGKEVLGACESGRIFRGHRGSLFDDTIATVSSSHSASIVGIAFSPVTDEEFATCSVDGTVKVWSMNDYSVKTNILVKGLQPSSIAFTYDAVVTGWNDGKVRCHHATTGENLWEIVNAHSGGVTALKLSGNKRFLVTGGENGELRVWELRMRELVSHLKEHSRPITEIAIFQDDIHALSCSRDRSLLCWDLRSEKRMSAHTQRMGGLNSMALSQDESIIITVGQERNITFWDLRESQPIFSIESSDPDMHEDEATCVAVSHSGSFFATGGNDEVVKLWKITNGGTPILVQNNNGHSGTVQSLAFSQDDKQLVSVGRDGAIFVWNIFEDPAK